MEKYEQNKYISKFEQQLIDIKKALKPAAMRDEAHGLEKEMLKDDFWQDTEAAQKTIARLNGLKEKIDKIDSLEQQRDDILLLSDMSEEDPSEEVNMMLNDGIFALDEALNDFEVHLTLMGKYDTNNAILELHPGAGGTESQDWCEMLYRMYLRWAQKRNFTTELLDYQAGDEAGIKSVTVLIKGKYAYGYLQAERGVHRLVRISPFDSNARRHTSFVSCDITPEINDEINIEIRDEDLKVDVYRSSGAGGQSVNTTDSAVRITHKPTNIVVTCQNERSQIKNRETAMGILKSKLLQEEIKKQEATMREIQGEQKDIGWGSQIRSYVFHPYAMVKDHRTTYEVGNVQGVMDGDIDGFINAFLKWKIT